MFDTVGCTTGRASGLKNWVLVCRWWRFDWKFCTSYTVAPIVTTISIVLGSSEIQNGDILVPAKPDSSGKWPLKRTVESSTVMLLLLTIHSYKKITNTLSNETTVQDELGSGYLPAAAASSWSVSISSSQATGIMSMKTSSDRIVAALVMTASGVCIRFITCHHRQTIK